MPDTNDSFSLFASVKVVRELLRRRIEDGAGHAQGELEAGLQEIETLWEELRSQSYALASERQRYSEFFEYAPDAYFVTDANGTLREANRAAAELLGVPADRLAGKPLFTFIPEAERREVRTRLLRASAQQVSEITEWRGTISPRGEGRAVAADFRVRALPAPDGALAPLCWLVRRVA